MDYRSWNYLRNKKLVVIERILIYGMGIDVYCLMFFLGVGVCTRASSPTWEVGWVYLKDDSSKGGRDAWVLKCLFVLIILHSLSRVWQSPLPFLIRMAA